MARTKKPVEEYSLISIKVRNHKARVGASINHKANDKRYQYDELRVYQFDSFLEIAGVCNYPEERSGDRYQITVYGDQPDEGDLNARLKEFHIKDKNGDPKYRKSRGHYLPVYEIPKAVGFLQKERGENSWNGCAWVSDQTVSMMLTLLERNGPVFAELHERRVARNRWINGLTLQTTDPAYE
jgi:hypothetical protein